MKVGVLEQNMIKRVCVVNTPGADLAVSGVEEAYTVIATDELQSLIRGTNYTYM